MKRLRRSFPSTTWWLPICGVFGCNVILGNEPGYLTREGSGGGSNTQPTNGGAVFAQAGNGSGGLTESTTITYTTIAEPQNLAGAGGDTLRIDSAGAAGLSGQSGTSEVAVSTAGTAGSGGATATGGTLASGGNWANGGAVGVTSSTGGRTNVGSLVCACTDQNSICHRGQCVMPAEVTAGGWHTCVRLLSGTVECWGSNYWGEVGVEVTSSSSVILTPTPVTGLSGVTAVAAGARFTCALISGGNVKCWGDNSSGQLGNGTYTSSSSPSQVADIVDAKSLSAGFDHTCAVISDGTLRCWGNNAQGQLGDGTNTTSARPVMVTGLLRAANVAAGVGFTCATVDGNVKCWGDNYFGQLGDGTGRSSLSPVSVKDLTGVTAIVTTSDLPPYQMTRQAHSAGSACARTSDGHAQCWGSNDLGQLGNGRSAVESLVPVVVTNLEHVETLAAGNMFVCATVADGNVKCWGDNGIGQLANDPARTDVSVTPITASQISKAIGIAAGAAHVCIQISAGIQCWGSNDYGQLGTGTRKSSYIPASVIW